MRQHPTPGLRLGRFQELDAAFNQSLVRCLDIIDLKRNTNKAPDEVARLGIAWRRSLEREMTFARCELRPAQLVASISCGDAERLGVKAKRLIPIGYEMNFER